MKNEIFVKCDCGCSLISINYEFGNVWIDIYENGFYNAQTRISDLIKNRLDILKHFITKKPKYFAEITLKKDAFENFTRQVNDLNKTIKSSIEENDTVSSFDSNIYIEYDKDIDDYVLSVRSNYNFKDVLTGKNYRYYNINLTKEDFDKLTNRLNDFVNKNIIDIQEFKLL